MGIFIMPNRSDSSIDAQVKASLKKIERFVMKKGYKKEISQRNAFTYSSNECSENGEFL